MHVAKTEHIHNNRLLIDVVFIIQFIYFRTQK